MQFDVVCVAFPAWEGDYVKSTVHLMSELASRRKVLYIDYQYTIKDVLQALRRNPFRIPVKHILGLKNRVRTIQLPNGATIYVLSVPPIFPINFIKKHGLFDLMLRFNALLMRSSIKKALAQLQIKEYVMVNAYNPIYGLGLFSFFQPHKQVYYCYDEISASVWAKDHGSRLEASFMQKADAMVVSSEGLWKSKKPYNDQIFTVKNGVDFNLFQTAFVPFSHKPLEKVIGYIGTLDQRIDYSIFEQMAQRFPTAKIVIVGRVLDDMADVKCHTDVLRQYPNIIFEGAKKPYELIDYLKTFHIGIIPFIKSEQTAAIYPMKVNEYLAAGLGVVATDFAPLGEFSSVIHIADTPDLFVEKVGDLLENDSDDKQKVRVAMAKTNSWQERGRQLDEVLTKIITSAKV